MEHGWYSYLKEHTLFFIPSRLDQDFDHLADEIDLFVITGGDDSVLRRTVEIKLASRMMQMHKPVLGICHGCFLLVDLLGGEVIDVDGHSDTQHDVIFQGSRRTVNSYHTLGIGQLHSGATNLVQDSDGHCEAWIDGTLAGVVWHPERMDQPWMPSEINNLIKI